MKFRVIHTNLKVHLNIQSVIFNSKCIRINRTDNGHKREINTRKEKQHFIQSKPRFQRKSHIGTDNTCISYTVAQKSVNLKHFLVLGRMFRFKPATLCVERYLRVVSWIILFRTVYVNSINNKKNSNVF